MDNDLTFLLGSVISRPSAGIVGRIWVDDSVQPITLYYDTGTDWVQISAVREGVKVPAKNGWVIFTDFELSTPIPFTTVQGSSTIYSLVSGEENRVGILSMSTGTGAGTNTRTAVVTSATSMLLTSGIATFEATIRIQNLSDASGAIYDLRLGFVDSSTAANPTDGIYFEYDTDVSPNWGICWSSGGSETRTTTDIPAVAGSWINYKITYNSVTGVASFYMDGVLIGSFSSVSFPSTFYTGCGIAMTKPSSGGGSGAAVIHADWMRASFIFATPRT